MPRSLHCLLLQVRNSDDPMRQNEVRAFARVLGVATEAIGVFDLIHSPLPARDLAGIDLVLLGGSGHYSVVTGGPFFEWALDSLRLVHDSGVATFASCWGFQAMARALGGVVTHDLERAELGTRECRLTDAGRADPVFGSLPDPFAGQMGHEDHVVELPPGATLLAHSTPPGRPDLKNLQAYRFDGRPIYCTQFHPELTADDLRQRVRAYPAYVRKIAGTSLEEFDCSVSDSPETEALLARFVAEYVPLGLDD
jgi:GMP synthase (glutamine-hydrolysing)